MRQGWRKVLLNCHQLHESLWAPQLLHGPTHTPAGYIGSLSLLETVARVAEKLRQRNPDLVYGERWRGYGGGEGGEKHPKLMVTDSPEPTTHLKLQFAQHAPFVRSRHCCQFPCCPRRVAHCTRYAAAVRPPTPSSAVQSVHSFLSPVRQHLTVLPP
jgi:hypothetical protein